MGIRYERDSRRATNGPLIFFTSIVDETFKDEIESAIINNLSFYAYKFPGDSMFSYGSSEGYLEGIGEKGFVIGSFSPDLPMITIPYSGVKKPEKITSRYTMPSTSTDFNEYSREVSEIIKQLKEGKGEKVVAAIVKVEEKTLQVPEKFYEFCTRFPDAMVFCFGTPATGCWIGATPELLLEGKEDYLFSMALAGTRLSGTKGEWDEKNREEQRIVKDYILEVFKANRMNPEPQPTYNRKTGIIEHICTPIISPIDEDFTLNRLEKLIRDLSPTPALCGLPKQFALETLTELENFDRGCYGGFCGPFHSPVDFTFNVVLRCGSFTRQKLCIYAGGGITAKSEVNSEWNEIETKIQSVFGKS